MSLFKTAEAVPTRLKMYVYGETGTGKTVTALQFPKPAVIDSERGTEYYGKLFKFTRKFTGAPEEVKAAIDELIVNPQGHKTFVIDSFTAVYDNILNEHETRMRVKTGDPQYTLKPLDYRVIRSEVKGLILKLLSLDMNIIVTARSATLYSSEEFMKVIGSKPEGPKDLPYLFDVVLKLEKNPENPKKFIATVEKDRTNLLPATFDFSYQSFVEYLGMEGLEREPVVFDQAAKLAANKGRTTTVKFSGKDTLTAGVSAKSLGIIQTLSKTYTEAKLKVKIQEDYFAESVLDLKDDEAKLLIEDIKKELDTNTKK